MHVYVDYILKGGVKMLEKICQSCAMAMQDESNFGKNSDGSKSDKYCKYCYPNGNFSKDESLEEMVESCIPFRLNDYSDEKTARECLTKQISQLERWKTA